MHLNKLTPLLHLYSTKLPVKKTKYQSITTCNYEEQQITMNNNELLLNKRNYLNPKLCI